ncbi:polycystic kidney disease protein 1-like 2 [Protopterus annectens]|uniref:polycystic kidney disease protein 1-like 2 n=1 Tax=Protopterus annectens TaxID=7888 RepID=UPI001CF9F918|nr:polycystic kidney disease protein 1-like 2 [Protopterus annectens]
MGLSLFILLILISSTGILNGGTSCPRNQLAFDSSCYEFINKSCNFRKAEEWCEKKGGHLVFIQNDETQQFLQTHLSENHEWWIGLAPPVKNLGRGFLSWLDTSDVSYSNWYTDQPSSPTAQCGYILKNSKFMWGATDDCNQEYFFICQHELGHAIACDHFNSTLHCGPGEVIEIDDSFYGRKSPHFCSLENATDIKLAEECSWIPVKDEISGLCQKLQECQVTSDGMSFGNPCPSLGNYLAVDYHCKEGLQISVEDIVSTFENVTISLKWLIQSPTGNLSCIINTGDRPEVESYSPKRDGATGRKRVSRDVRSTFYTTANLPCSITSVETILHFTTMISSSSVVHRYLSPGLLTITAECTSAELNITAKKAITVQAPISDWGPIRCIKKDKLEEGSNCTIPLGETFNIQVEVKEGTNITYTVIAGNITLAKATSGTGTSPCNITIDHASQKLIGPGIHQLDITADNNVTASEILQKMIINLLEPVSDFHVGLKAIILEKGETLQMNVSVAHGAPLTLIFEFIGINDTISETRKYLGSEPTVYYIPVKLEGSYLVKATAANDVSRISLDVGNITVRANASEENAFDKCGMEVRKAIKKNETEMERLYSKIEHINKGISDLFFTIEEEKAKYFKLLKNIEVKCTDVQNRKFSKIERDLNEYKTKTHYPKPKYRGRRNSGGHVDEIGESKGNEDVFYIDENLDTTEFPPLRRSERLSIPHDIDLEWFEEMLVGYQTLTHGEFRTVLVLMETVLKNNFIFFEGEYFKQAATVDKTICISPGEEVKPSSNVRLQYPKEVNTTYKWTCGICWTEWEICIHQKRIETDTYVLSIPSSCLPAPNSAVSLILTVNQSEVSEIKEQCLKVTAAKNLNVQIKCKDDCKSVKSQQMAVLTVSCKKCNDQYKWYLVNSATEQPSSSTGPCLQKKIQQNALTLLKSGTSTLKLNDTDLQQYGQVFKVRVIGMTENQYGQDDYIINTLPPPSPPSCLISPTEGTVFTSFSINCSTSTTNETIHPAIAAYTSLTYCVYISSDITPYILIRFYKELIDLFNNQGLDLLRLMSKHYQSQISSLAGEVMELEKDIKSDTFFGRYQFDYDRIFTSIAQQLERLKSTKIKKLQRDLKAYAEGKAFPEPPTSQVTAEIYNKHNQRPSMTPVMLMDKTSGSLKLVHLVNNNNTRSANFINTNSGLGNVQDTFDDRNEDNFHNNQPQQFQKSSRGEGEKMELEFNAVQEGVQYTQQQEILGLEVDNPAVMEAVHQCRAIVNKKGDLKVFNYTEYPIDKQLVELFAKGMTFVPMNKNTPLACEQQPTISSVYLPLGKKEQDYNVTVRISASNKVGDVVSTNVYVKVRNMALNDSKSMQNVLKEKRSELLDRESSSSLMQLYMAVSSILKEETAIEPNTKKQVKEEMLSDLPAINVSSIQTAQSVSTVLEEITQNPDELSPTAQLEASNTLISLSGSLLALQTEDGDDNIQRNTAATSLFSAMSNVLEASAQHSVQSSEKNATKQVLFTDNLMSTVTNLQSVFLLEKESGGEPTILNAPSLTMYVNRLERDQIDKSPINVTHSMSASFTLPSLSSSNLLYGVEENETVDVRMVSFAVNPFAWSTTAEINGAVGGLALTRTNGSHILVSELMEDIEITLPRLNMTQVNKTQLRLSNSSSVMVNVSSENDSLVMQFDPEKDIPLAVYLQYGFQPNQTHYDHKIQLTEEQITEDGQYTWVLNPGNLTGAGTYYLLVTMSEESNSASSANNTVEISSFVAQCLFWNETNSSWNGNGCRVGPKTTASSTQCLCNHLTFFASSFFVMPNVIDVSKTVELFATFVNNPVVVTTVGSIFLLYILVVVWARRKDIQYSSKVKLTVLEDNDPFDQYRYVLTVVTGHRRGAATTSKVTIILYGSEGESEPHHLADPEKPLFERGASDVFLLTTPFSLGELQSIRLWHDNSGSNPSWYINRVMVHDLDMDKKWYFLCNSWLSIDVGECILDKVFQVATEEDLKTFSNLFFMKTAKDFRDGHIWYSVINRPAISSFTTVQRVSCCFSLLLCTMLTSIMFYGVPKDPAEQKMDLGTIEITWQEVMIGFESSLLVFPVNLLIVQLFRHIRPRQSKEQKERKQGKHGRISPNLPTPQTPPFETIHISSLTPEAVIKDIRRIANSLSKLLKTPLPAAEKEFGKTTDINKLLALVEEIICQQNRAGQEFYDKSKKREDTLILTMGSTDLRENLRSPSPDKGVKRNDYGPYLYTRLQHVEKELDLLGPEKFQNRQSYLQAVQQVQHMKDILENQLYSDPAADELCSPPPSLPEETKKNRCSGGLPWWFVFFGWMLLAATSGVSAFFTMLYGLHYGKDRSIKWLISMAISFFESLLVTQPLKVLGLAAFFALVLKKVELEDEEPLSINGSISNQGAPNLRMGTRRDSNSNIYQPPPPTDIERMKQHRIKEQKVFALIREIVAYLGFLWMLLLVAYGQRDPNSYYLNNHIQSSFTNGFADVLSYQGFFTWANTTLINKLYGPYPGFITDGNSKLVGSARIRQIRVKKDACSIPKLLRSDIRECHTPYSLEDEDMSDYGVHWNVTVPSNSSFLSNVWHYQSQSMLRGHPFWGQLDMYRGGGYVASLGTDAQNATRVLQYIFDNVWLDTYTRAIFIEFTVYNANVNLFCIVTLILETNGIGAFVTSSELKIVRLYPYTDGLHIFVIAAEVIYFLFVIYYMVVQGKLMKEQRWGYFKSKWNLLELAIILISWSALSVYIQRTILGTRDLTYYEDHRDEFVSFYDTATADTALGYLIAFLVLLATVKLWHLMRLNPKLNMITSTLKRAWDDISGFIVVIFIMFLAYSIATNLMFGWTLSSYKTVFDAAITMVSLQLGIFNYQEVLDYNPVLASFLIGTCIIFMTFVVLNLFISVILVAFSEEQINYKIPFKEEEKKRGEHLRQ